MNPTLIAPCGMNCGTCLAYLRDKNTCSGCWGDNKQQRLSCTRCSIRNCEHLEKTESKFCYECTAFPCKRLKQLDKRYRTRYNVSFIENLQQIKLYGLKEFLLAESNKWMCKTCGGTICVHRGHCLACAKPELLRKPVKI